MPRVKQVNADAQKAGEMEVLFAGVGGEEEARIAAGRITPSDAELGNGDREILPAG
ncbi:MAG: hypothetical protein HYS34_03000 [Acidobacteria bacterium]|nr:hypothetical protein [Acidobacteriota bacterium]